MKYILIVPALIILAGCYSPPKLAPEYVEDNRILNSTEYSEDTKREILRARYLERMDRLETKHDPSEYRPVVDKKICPSCPYDKDLATCSNLAREHTNNLDGAASGAAIGAGIFAAVGAVAGVDYGSMAATGATLGGIQGLSGSVSGYRQIIARCMQGRGYSVLQ